MGGIFVIEGFINGLFNCLSASIARAIYNKAIFIKKDFQIHDSY